MLLFLTRQKLKSKDPKTRAAAIAELGKAREVPLLLEMLADEVDSVRLAAAQWLGRLRDPRAADPLTTLLADGDALIRRTAADALGDIRDSTTVAPLVALLSDHERDVRNAAATALGKIGALAVPGLLPVLGDPEPQIRQAAIQALVGVGNPAISSLAPLLKHDAALMRQSAVESLARIGTPQAADALLPLSLDPTAEVRQAVLEALIKLRWKPSSPQEQAIITVAQGRCDEALVFKAGAGGPLVAALNTDDAALRKSAALALGKLGDPRAKPALTQALTDSNFFVRQAVIEALHRLQWTPSDARERALFAVGLGKYDDALAEKDAALPPLIDALQAEDPAVRIAVARALGKLGEHGATDALIATLGDEEPSVRAAAADALAQLRDPSAQDALVRAVEDCEANVCIAAVHALGAIANAETLGAVLGLLHDEDASVRHTVAETLAAYQDERAVPQLTMLLAEDPMPEVRQAAAASLLALGEIAMRVLVSMLGNTSTNMVKLAKNALRQLPTLDRRPLVASLVNENADLRTEALEVLHDLQWEPTTGEERALAALAAGRYADVIAEGVDAVEPLLLLLHDPDGDVRAEAADALGRIGDRRAIPPLVDAFGDEHLAARKAMMSAVISIMGEDAGTSLSDALRSSFAYVRKEAAMALGELQNGKYVVPLLASLKDNVSEVRRTVAWALGQIGDARGVIPLIDMLKDTVPEVREEVARALGELRDERATDILLETLRDDSWRAVREAAAEALGKIEEARGKTAVDR